MNNKNIYKIFFILFLFFFSHNVFAAELRLSSDLSTVNIGETVRVKILVNANESINAVSGQILFPKNILQVQSLSKSNSIINQWAVEPSYSNNSGVVSLEGVSLAGYKGSNGTVLTIIFKAKNSGTASLQIDSGSILANDGEGTNVMNLSRGISIVVSNNIPKEKPVVLPKENVISKVVNSEIKIEEIKKKDEMDPKSRFLITSSGINVKTPYRVEVDSVSQVWNDSGNHIFETAQLTRGTHILKVYNQGINGEIISESISFITSGILTPVITDYSNDIKENEFIVVKGFADPLTYVVINSDGIINTKVDPIHESVTVRTNEKGLFTYVSDTRVLKGIYMITARAYSDGGIESDITAPIKISVSGNLNIFKKMNDILSLAVPFFSLLILFIILIIYGVYRIIYYRKGLNSKLREAEAVIQKSFGILEEDLNEEVKIFKKVKMLEPLTSDEKAFVKQFKKDLRAAEKVIVEEVKNTKKNKS